FHLSGTPHLLFLTDTPSPDIYTLSLHDALPISQEVRHLVQEVDEQTAAFLPDKRLSHRRREITERSRHPIERAHEHVHGRARSRSEEHTSELQSRENLVCRLLLEKKKNKQF